MLQKTKTKIKVKNTVDTLWSEIDGVWHNVVNLRTVCSQKYILGDLSEYEKINKESICQECWDKIENVRIGREPGNVKFNIKIFGNERMMLILRKLKMGDKKMSEMKDLIEGTGKRHMEFELGRLLENELIVKEETKYRLTEKGIIAEFIGSLILDLRDIDEKDTKKMVEKIEGMGRGE